MALKGKMWKPRCGEAFIYAIRAGRCGPIKIGRTRSHPRQRLRTLQTGCPDRLELLGFYVGHASDEDTRHEGIEATHPDARMSGEWFWPCDEVRAQARSIAALGRMQSIFGRDYMDHFCAALGRMHRRRCRGAHDR